MTSGATVPGIEAAAGSVASLATGAAVGAGDGLSSAHAAVTPRPSAREMARMRLGFMAFLPPQVGARGGVRAVDVDVAVAAGVLGRPVAHRGQRSADHCVAGVVEGARMA